jgi:hypothetical protein
LEQEPEQTSGSSAIHSADDCPAGGDGLVIGIENVHPADAFTTRSVHTPLAKLTEPSMTLPGATGYVVVESATI